MQLASVLKYIVHVDLFQTRPGSGLRNIICCLTWATDSQVYINTHRKIQKKQSLEDPLKNICIEISNGHTGIRTCRLQATTTEKEMASRIAHQCHLIYFST